jgi:putative lipase involved disintegration of autophagic bodies
MFSCCCGKVDFTWTPVCGCYNLSSICQEKCLRAAAQGPGTYYAAASNIYYQVRRMYPTSTIWLTGHSLGGALAGLLTVAHPGTAAITFESPGARLFAQRLGLLRGNTHRKKDGFGLDDTNMFPVANFMNSADPIPFGQCTGVFSACYYGGYALETSCHLGSVCIYEVDNEKLRKKRPAPPPPPPPQLSSSFSEESRKDYKLLLEKWSYDIHYHQLETVIEDVIKKSERVPPCRPQIGCVDCPEWTFV